MSKAEESVGYNLGSSEEIKARAGLGEDFELDTVHDGQSVKGIT